MKLESLEFEFADAMKKGAAEAQTLNININIPRIEQAGSSIKVYFVYTASYLPSQSYIRIGGISVFSGTDAVDAYKSWLKNKRVDGTLGEQIINSISYAAASNAVFIARIFNMMPPIAPPQIKLGGGVVEGTAPKPKK